MHSMRIPELPPDVWSHVASFLPVKDAARLSGERSDQILGQARALHCQILCYGAFAKMNVRSADCRHPLQESAGRHRGFN